MEEKVYELIDKNSNRIGSLEDKFNKQDSTIQLMQKDYEYMKKGLDNIEKQTDSNFKVINSKLDDIYKQKTEESISTVREIKEMKGYVLKTIVGMVVAAVVLYIFPFLK